MTMVTIKTYKSTTPALAKNMIEQNLVVHGGNLFNMLLERLRGYSGMVNGFKLQLNDKSCSNPIHRICI